MKSASTMATASKRHGSGDGSVRSDGELPTTSLRRTVRKLCSLVARKACVPYRTFLKWNAAGGIVWGGGVVVLGYVFAHSLHSLERALKYWSFVLVAAVIFAIWQINKQIDAAMERVEDSLDESPDA
jgi:hypothetical protein